MYLLYECKIFSFKYSANDIPHTWKSTGLNNSTNSDMDAIALNSAVFPSLNDNGRMSAKFIGSYFRQTRLIRPNNNKVINVYIVYKLDPISNSRNTDYTVQNALLGGVKLTKNATDTIKKNTKDTEYVLMKAVCSAWAILSTVETF